MPYFKPRFMALKGTLELVPVPQQDTCAAVLQPWTSLQALRHTDGYYGNFAEYCRFSFTPIARKIWELSSRATNLVLLLQDEEPDLDLLIALMHRLEGEVRQDHARVIFMFLPDREVSSPGWRSKLPDQYGHMLARMRQEQFSFLDGRQVLLESQEALGDLYYKDQVHFTAQGNRVIGAALKPLL